MSSLPTRTYPSDSQHLVRGILKSMLQVEDEAAAIKTRTGRHTDWPQGRVRLDTVVGDDMAIALQVIQRVKQEQAEEERLQKYKYLKDKKPRAEYDPRDAIEERHRKVAEKRQHRKQLKTASDQANDLNRPIRTDMRNSTDTRLSALRKRQQELESELDPEALQSIKEEVKREAAQMKELDLVVRKQKAQLDEMQKIQQARDELAKEKEERQQHIRNLHARQLLDRVDSALSNYCWKLSSWSFQSLCDFSIGLKSREMKFGSKRKVAAKGRAWAWWRRTAKNSMAQREMAEYERRQERERMLEATAVEFERSWASRKVLVAWVRAVKELKVEREAEAEAAYRRRKIEQMMAYVKTQAEIQPDTFDEQEESYEEPPQTVLHVSTKARPQLRTYSQSLSIVTPPSFSPQKEPEIIDVQPVYYNHQPEIVEEEESNESVPRSVSETSSCNSKKSKIPKELEKMQQREEERRRRREALDSKYKAKQEEELRRQKEAELKAAEDEKQRKREVVLKKKQAEAEKRAKEEQKQQELLKLKEQITTATSHRARTVAVRYVFKGLKSAVDKSKEKTEVAEKWSRIQTLKWGLLLLGEAMRNIQAEHEQAEANREMEAWFVYLEHLQTLVFKGLRERIARRKTHEVVAEEHYKKSLKSSVFRWWCQAQSTISAEKAAFDLKSIPRADAFYKTRLGLRVLNNWLSYIEDAREERLKEAHAEEMWLKVKNWLGDS